MKAICKPMRFSVNLTHSHYSIRVTPRYCKTTAIYGTSGYPLGQTIGVELIVSSRRHDTSSYKCHIRIEHECSSTFHKSKDILERYIFQSRCIRIANSSPHIYRIASRGSNYCDVPKAQKYLREEKLNLGLPKPESASGKNAEYRQKLPVSD